MGTSSFTRPTVPGRPVAVAVTALALATFTVGAVVHQALAAGGPAWLAWPVLAVGSAAVGAMALFGLVRPLEARAVAERRAGDEVRHELETVLARHRFVAEIDPALAGAATESDVLAVIGRGLLRLWPDRDSAVLLSPSDEARVTWSIAVTPTGLGDPRSLGGANACSSLAAGAPVVHRSSTDLGACAHLAAQGAEVSSVCLPLRVGDGHLGAVHSVGAPGDLPDPEEIALLGLLVARAGDRIAVLRERTGVDPVVACDPLTGLPDHHVARRAVRDCIAALEPFSVALCDLDGFARYNEEHGWDTGDRALRCYAEVMCDTLRPGDVITRFGSDKFLAVFPGCTAPNALAAMERVRENLVLAATAQETPPVSASVGIAHSSQGTSIDDIIESAEIALLVAKNEGGNRVRLASFEMVAHLPTGSEGDDHPR